MQALTDKTARLHARTKVLLRPDALAPLRAQIAALVAERADAEAKAALAREKLEALGAEFKGREAELEELRNAEAVKDEWERKVRESAEEVEELQDTRARLEEEISSLEDSKQELVLCVSVCC
jgi:chromosome segregation ATPase